MRTIDSEDGEDMPRVFARVLAALQASRDQRVRTIAAAADISPTHAHRIIRKLKAAGLITINSDPGYKLDVSVNPRPNKSRK
jgi:DNA-binding IclR family transcriptional regulator